MIEKILDRNDINYDLDAGASNHDECANYGNEKLEIEQFYVTP